MKREGDDVIPILGIDAGLSFVGWVVIDISRMEVLTGGVIATKPSPKKMNIGQAFDDARRCQEIGRELGSIFHAHKPVVAAVEVAPPGGTKRKGPGGGWQPAHQRSIKAFGLGVGAIAATLECLDVGAEFVMPAKSKKATTGRATAKKTEVEAAVQRLFLWPDIDRSGPRSRRKGLAVVPPGQMEHVYDAAAAAFVAIDSPAVRAIRANTERIREGGAVCSESSAR